MAGRSETELTEQERSHGERPESLFGLTLLVRCVLIVAKAGHPSHEVFSFSF